MESLLGYKPPLRDIKFALEHLADLAALSKLDVFAHADPATVDVLLEECGRFVSGVLAPLDRLGDREGASFDASSSQVRVPQGWTEAYRAYVDGGWEAVPFPAEIGGGQFPWLVGVALQELVTSANMAFSLCPMLTQGAIHMLLHHGSPEQREVYLPKMVTGEWAGTMDLTEPQAGSDVGAVATKAVPVDDGTWRITGQKIFITYGDHEMADNIVHLVLARVPGAPPGTRGISCFIVPKYLPDPEGGPGSRNSFRCSSIEHKMGIHASPTCVMDFDAATGFLIGEANAGMSYMFTMMNAARLAVGLEGLAVAEASYQKAFQYVSQRVQGRPAVKDAGPGATIVEHPDVRRSLLTMRSLVEAMRGLLYINAQAIDEAAHAATDAERAAARDLCDVLIPISKAWCTDTGTEVVDIAVQLHGGMGYIEETGVAQHYRDIRIASIYEGTNGIQAVDLVSRKLQLRGGAAMEDLIGRVEALDAELAEAGQALGSIRGCLSEAVGSLRQSTAWLLSQPEEARAAVLAGASPYLQQWGLVLGGWILARQALVALPSSEQDPYLAAKLATARFYCEQLLPAAVSLTAAVTAGAAPLYAVEAQDLRSQ